MKSTRFRAYPRPDNSFFFKRKKKDSKEKTSKLEQVGIWFTIVGGTFSVFFAAYSILLTLKISKQQTEIKNLNEVIFELRKQNQTSSFEIDEIKKQTSLLQKQAILSANNNILLNSQIRTSTFDKNIVKSKELKEIMDLIIDFGNIDLQLYTYDSSFVKDISYGDQLAFFQRIMELLNKGLNNSYIVSNSKIYSYWYIFSEQTKFTYDRYLISTMKGVNLGGKQLTKEQFLIPHFLDFKRYFGNFMENGINILEKTKTFSSDRSRRLKEANYGRSNKK